MPGSPQRRALDHQGISVGVATKGDLDLLKYREKANGSSDYE